MSVYKAINKVQAELASTGIAKDKRNTQGSGYNFRGIDDVYNALAPLLAKHGLCVIPRFVSRQIAERQSQKGGALFYVTVEAEFDFVSADDGSKHTARTFGEAMDSGDKATNKAMSAAYKYAAFQTFAIPTEGQPDADQDTHHVAAEFDGMSAHDIEQVAALLVEMHQAGDDVGAVRVWYDPATFCEQEYGTAQEARKYAWGQLGDYSKLRSAIKANKPAPEQAGESR